MPGSVAGMDPAAFWIGLVVLVACAAVGLVGAFVFYRRLRVIADTPTAKVRSAHQGYVELEGLQELMDGTPIVSPLTGSRCTWYRYKVERRESRYVNGKRRTEWRKIRGATSDELFLLVDDTGRCVVDPEGAAVTPTAKDRWYGNSPQPLHGPSGGRSWLASGEYRYTEERMHPADPLYAIGMLKTVGGAGDLGDAREELRATLKAWKADPARMRQFDADGDGHIDLHEWEAARSAAQAEIMKARAERAASGGADILMKPADRSRPYLLSAVPQERLIGRYRWYAAGMLLLFFAAGSGAVWLVNNRPPLA